ncbi:MAG: hypothetical protein J6I76_03265 [Oribacterium sp.]|nr:hypothetical protein [Oribacterium sp.]
MSGHIDEEKARIWNERFELKLKENNLSQRTFIQKYREKFGSGSQADVSKWMHIGHRDGRTNGKRGFPAFETMCNIAEILGVSIGYMIGETDNVTFDIEKTSEYLGLSELSIKAIKNIMTRNFDSIKERNFKWVFSQLDQSLECLLQNPLFIDYLYGIGELANTIRYSENMPNPHDLALKIIPEKYRNDVETLHNDVYDAIDKGIDTSSDVLWAFEKLLDNADYEATSLPDTANQNINAAKYELYSTHNKLIDSLISNENISKLYVLKTDDVNNESKQA